jgi:hypothetical protein
MTNVAKVTLCGLLFAGVAWPADGQDKDARAIIDKALKAHGGADKLAKFPASHIKGKGGIEAMGMNINFTIEAYSQEPDKARSVIDLDLGGKQVTVISVVNGGKAWESIAGQAMEVKDKKKLEKNKADMYVQRVGNLVVLQEKGYDLSLLGETKVKDEDTVGVRVSSKGMPDVSLYFSKKTGLLIKSEYRTTEPFNNNEVNQEGYHSDYKDVDGVKVAHKLVVQHDGKRYLEMEFSEVKRLEKIADSMFGPP